MSDIGQRERYLGMSYGSISLKTSHRNQCKRVGRCTKVSTLSNMNIRFNSTITYDHNCFSQNWTPFQTYYLPFYVFHSPFSVYCASWHSKSTAGAIPFIPKPTALVPSCQWHSRPMTAWPRDPSTRLLSCGMWRPAKRFHAAIPSLVQKRISQEIPGGKGGTYACCSYCFLLDASRITSVALR